MKLVFHRLIATCIASALSHFPQLSKYLYSFLGEGYRPLAGFVEAENPLSDFKTTSAGNLFGEVNVVFPGHAQKDETIDKTLPTFFINARECDFSGYDIPFFASGDYGVAKSKKFEHGFLFLPSNMQQNSFIIKKQFENVGGSVSLVYVDHCSSDSFKLGSGVRCVVGLLGIARKVNIFRWDQYLEGNEKKLPCYVKKFLAPPDYGGRVRLNALFISVLTIYYFDRIHYAFPERVYVQGRAANLLGDAMINKIAKSVVNIKCGLAVSIFAG